MTGCTDVALEEMRKKVIAWIPHISFESDHHAKISEWLPGTGQWLLEDRRLLEWMSDSNSKSDALLVQGKSGCGKSFLAAVVVDKLKKESETSHKKTAVAYVYCSNREDAKINPYDLKGSILKQLYLQTPDDASIPTIESMCNNSQSESASPEQLEKAISIVSSCFKQTYIIVDGLDECARLKHGLFEGFCSFLRSLADTAPSIFKILIFSRPQYTEVEQAFGSYPLVKVDSGANTQDIKQFIASRVLEKMLHVRNEPDLLKYVEKELFLKSDGMFLWVGLQVPSLQAVRTIEDIKDVLEDLPLTLDEFYSGALRRILHLEPRFRRERALKVLLWVANARRPLTRAELTEALAIKPGLSDLHGDSLIAEDDGIAAECGDLIVLKDGRYQLVHTSLQDYLCALLASKPDDLKPFWVLQINANEALGEACLTYLQFDKFRAGPLSDLETFQEFQEKNAFYKYAASYWGCHVIDAHEDQFRDKIVTLVSCNELRELFLQNFRVSHDYPQPGIPYRGSSTPLHALAVFNLAKTAASMEGTSEQRRKCDGFGYLPLDFTLVQKNRSMCKWLLQDQEDFVAGWYAPLHMVAQYDWAEHVIKLASLGCDPEGKVGDRQHTALHVAAMHGCKTATIALLDMKVSVDPIDVKRHTPLLCAAENNHFDLMSLLLRTGANANHKADEDLTALHFVAMNGNTEAAKELFKHGSEIEARAGEHKTLTPLHLAAQHGHCDMIRLLVAKGANIESESLHNNTPLLLACSSGSLISFHTLLLLGARLEARDEHGRSSLARAAAAGHVELVEAIYKENAKLIEVADKGGDTPLHVAIKFKQPHIATALLKLGAPVDRACNTGFTPLHLAVISGYVDLVFALATNHRVDLYAKAASNESLLHLACREGNFPMVKALVQLIPNLDFVSRDDFLITPLHYAVESGSTDITKFLLELGLPAMNEAADKNPPLLSDGSHEQSQEINAKLVRDGIDLRCTMGRTALYTAAVKGRLDLVMLLLHAGANPSISSNTDESPLLLALAYQYSDVAEALLNNGADPKTADQNGRTPLYEAARTGNYKLTEKLLEAECDGLCRTAWGSTPFTVAVGTNKVELIDLFVKYGFNGTNLSNKYGQTAYHSAAQDGNIELLEKLIDNGNAGIAELGARDIFGRSPIYLAAARGHIEVVDRLAQLGIEVNITPHSAPPTICIAARFGCVDMISRLLQLGADLEAIDDEEGMTPLIWAAAFRNPKTFRYLLNLGACSTRKDLYGRTALDYAIQIPQLGEELGEEALQNYQPDESAGRKILWRTIRGRLSSLSRFPTKPTVVEQFQRQKWMRTLAYALLTLHDDPNHKSAVTCFTELGNPSKESEFHGGWVCNICRRELGYEKKYVCTICHTVDLCSRCHSDYVRGSKAPRQKPFKLRTLEILEENFGSFRNVLFQYSDVLKGTGVAAALKLSPSALEWFDKRVEVLHNWEIENKEQQEFNIKAFPGVTFLNLVDKSRKISQEQNATTDRQTDEKDHSGKEGDATVAKEQTERVIMQTSETDQRKDELLSEVNESFRQLLRDYRPNKEITTFTCSGHEYIEIPDKDWNENDTNAGPFDHQGRVTQEWFLELLERYPTEEPEILVSQEVDATRPETGREIFTRPRPGTTEVEPAPGYDALELVPSIDRMHSIPDSESTDSVCGTNYAMSTSDIEPIATIDKSSSNERVVMLEIPETVESAADPDPFEEVNAPQEDDPIDVSKAEKDEVSEEVRQLILQVLRLKMDLVDTTAYIVRNMVDSTDAGNQEELTLGIVALKFLIMEAFFQFVQLASFGNLAMRLFEDGFEEELKGRGLLDEADIDEYSSEMLEQGQREKVSYLRTLYILRDLQRIPASVEHREDCSPRR